MASSEIQSPEGMALHQHGQDGPAAELAEKGNPFDADCRVRVPAVEKKRKASHHLAQTSPLGQTFDCPIVGLRLKGVEKTLPWGVRKT